MGWTFYNSIHIRPNGTVDRKKEVDNEFTREGLTVLKSTMVGTVYYGAIKQEKTGVVFGLVVLTSSYKKGGYNFGYKNIDETCGPVEDRCPLSILNLLTPTDYKHANDWRERCREYHKQKKSPTSFANLPVGTKVIWTIPYEYFSVGSKGDKVELVKKKLGRGHAYWYNPRGNWRIRPKYVDMVDCVIAS